MRIMMMQGGSAGKNPVNLHPQDATAKLNIRMTNRRVDALKTAVGSAGWTKPEVRQLHEEKWRTALAHDPKLMQIQRTFDLAQGALHQAQEAYMELPEPRFFIR